MNQIKAERRLARGPRANLEKGEEYAPAVLDALNHLSLDDRMLLVRYYADGLSYRELMDEFGMKRALIGNRLRRARQRLAALLEKKGIILSSAANPFLGVDLKPLFCLKPAHLARLFRAAEEMQRHGDILTAWQKAGIPQELIQLANETGPRAWPWPLIGKWLAGLAAFGVLALVLLFLKSKDHPSPNALPHRIQDIHQLGE